MRCEAGLLIAALGLCSMVVAAGCSANRDRPAANPTERCSDEVFRAATAIHRVDFQRAMALLSGGSLCPRGQLLRSLALIAQSRRAEALTLLQAIASQSGEHVGTKTLAWELLAVEQGTTTNDDEARAALQAADRALTLDPRAHRARLLRALLRGGADREAAFKDLMALAATQPPWQDPRDLYLKELAQWCTDFISEDGVLPETAPAVAHQQLGFLLYEMGRRRTGMRGRALLEQARHSTRFALRDPVVAQDPRTVELEAKIHRELQDFPAAIELLTAQLKRFPQDQELRAFLLQLYNRVGRHSETVAAAGTLEIKTCPPCALAVAEALDRQNDPNAVGYLIGLVQLQPGNAEALSHLGRILIRRDRLEEGIDYLQRAVGLNPMDQAALLALGPALSRTGKTDEAEAWAQKYQEVHQTWEERAREAETMNNLVSAYADAQRALQQGDLARVEELITQMAERDPRFQLLPLLRISLALKRAIPPNRDDLNQFLEAALARNPWLMDER